MTQLIEGYSGPRRDAIGRVAANRNTRDRLTLRRMVRGLSDGLPWFLAVLVGVVALAVAVLMATAPQYTASVTIGPTARTGAAAMGVRTLANEQEITPSLVEQGSGHESLSDFTRFLVLVTSVPVAERLAEDQALLRGLFPDRWNDAAGGWEPSRAWLPWLRRQILGAFGRRDWVVPDGPAVAAALRKRLGLEVVGGGPLHRLHFRHEDRDTALTVLRRVVAEADGHLRAEARRRSTAEIAYVRRQLEDTRVAEHRRALTALLAEHERMAMMIEVDLPFAADTLEPVHAAAEPDWPDLFAVLAVTLVAALSLGLLAAYGRHLYVNNRE